MNTMTNIPVEKKIEGNLATKAIVHKRLLLTKIYWASFSVMKSNLDSNWGIIKLFFGGQTFLSVIVILQNSYAKWQNFK
jgi:hypothetical protein